MKIRMTMTLTEAETVRLVLGRYLKQARLVLTEPSHVDRVCSVVERMTEKIRAVKRSN